ncbi:MAG: XRE family transcriptional regulator [Propionibacteriaceae bacterium]|nr:XRE family transcriptional regulator [Propionibacteriaceae bacterium]
MNSKQTYQVTAQREGRWWVFTIPDLGTGGQARNLNEVAYEAQGVAAMWLDIAPEDVAVTLSVVGEDAVLAEWAAAENDEQAARAAQARAAARRRAVVKGLRAAGWSAPDTSQVLGISKQRVYQIEHADLAAA